MSWSVGRGYLKLPVDGFIQAMKMLCQQQSPKAFCPDLLVLKSVTEFHFCNE